MDASAAPAPPARFRGAGGGRAVLVLAAMVLGGEPVAAVESLQLLALTRDRAIMSIDGVRRVLEVGESSPEGVLLKQATSAFALIEIGGREQRLEPGPVTAPIGIVPGTVDRGRVVLWADPRGFFHADGTINGNPVRFLVDTGANTVALSERTAREIGIDLSRGKPGLARTAGGVVRIVGVTLDEVSVGSITLYNVDAGVLDGDEPDVPLLGASFLNHVDMQRAGQRMELMRK